MKAKIILMADSLRSTLWLTAIFFTLLPRVSYAQPGALDNTFGTGGTVTTSVGSLGDGGYSVAIQSDGKIVAAGDSYNGSDYDFAVVRYNTDGSLDNTFDNDGMVTTPVGSLSDGGSSVVIQPDGKIVVAGYSSDSTAYDFAVVRYNSDGSLDNSFDSDGKVTTAVGSSSDFATSVTTQPDGKIVVAGQLYNGADYDFAAVRYNSDGSLDNTFDNDGKVTTSVGVSSDFATSVALQPDGKIVVAGYSDNGADYDFAAVRYNSNGSLDNTFDSDGKVTTPVGSSTDFGNSVAIQPDGKIVVAGRSSNGSDDDFAIARYNSNGSLDNTFDSDGKASTPVGSSADFGTSVAIQPDGKIVMAGYSDNGANHDFAAVRYNSDGSLDNTFESDGKVTTPVGSSYDYGWSVAIQPDGKIVMAGYSSNGTHDDFAAVRYNSDGSLDNTFDSDGKVTTAVGSFNDEPYSVAIQPDGKIVAAGRSSNGTNDDFAVVRYNSNGSLDNTFDSDGKVTTPVGSSTDVGNSVAVQPDGKIVLAGYSYNGTYSDFAVVRYNSDGSLDTTFDSDGIVTTAIGSAYDQARSVAIQPDGKIVVAGFSSNIGSNYDFAVVRYNSDGTLDNTFDSDGKVTTPVGSLGDLGWSVAIQPDGKIVVAGRSDNGADYDFAVVRYNSDGSLDNTFDSDGIVTTPVGSSEAAGYSVAIQTDGKIVVAGYSYNDTDDDFAVVRYNSNGSLDNTFDSDGKLTTPVGGSDDIARSVAIQSDGEIVVAGESYSGTGDDFAVARYNSDGTLDNTFDSDGIVTTPFGSSEAAGHSVAIQQDGKIVVVGYSFITASDFAVARYGNDTTTGINPGADQGSEIKIYPNPVADLITVKASNNALGSTYIITDVIGRQVMTGKLNNESTTVDISQFATGVYLFQAGQQRKQTFKVMKE